MSELKVEKETISRANILSVEVGTNIPMGGDAGHGGKTVFRLKDEGATTWTLKWKDRYGKETEIDQPQEITIELYGDCEATTFIDALVFAFKSLTRQILSKTTHY